MTSTLHDRVVWAGFNQTNVIYQPTNLDPYAGMQPSSSQDSARPQQAGNYGAPKEIPLVRVGIYDGIVSYEDSQPLNDPAGLSIPEDSPGRWGQLYRAGRLYGR